MFSKSCLHKRRQKRSIWGKGLTNVIICCRFVACRKKLVLLPGHVYIHFKCFYFKNIPVKQMGNPDGYEWMPLHTIRQKRYLLKKCRVEKGLISSENVNKSACGYKNVCVFGITIYKDHLCSPDNATKDFKIVPHYIYSIFTKVHPWKY